MSLCLETIAEIYNKKPTVHFQFLNIYLFPGIISGIMKMIEI